MRYLTSDSSPLLWRLRGVSFHKSLEHSLDTNQFVSVFFFGKFVSVFL